MTNAKKAVRKLNRMYINIFMAALLVILSASACGLLLTADTDPEGAVGLTVFEVMKSLVCSVGAAYIVETFFRHSKAVNVLPVKRTDAAKMLYDKITALAAVPFITELFFFAIIFFVTLTAKEKDLSAYVVCSSAAKPLSLAAVSFAFGICFVTAFLIYAEAWRMTKKYAQFYKFFVYIVLVAALAVIKARCETAIITEPEFGYAFFAAYAVLAAAAGAIYFGLVRKKFAETFCL